MDLLLNVDKIFALIHKETSLNAVNLMSKVQEKHMDLKK